MSRPIGRAASPVALPRAAVWVLIALLVPALPLAIGSASGTPPSGSSWAYGGDRTFSGSTDVRGGTLSVSERVGYQVVLSQGPAVHGVVPLASRRVMGAVFSASYCAPACSDAKMRGTVSYHAFEILEGFANLSANGTTDVAGLPVAAEAVLNASTSIRSAEFDNDSVSVTGPLTTHVATSNLSLRIAGAWRLSFLGGLGLYPLNASGAGSWTSTSAFVSTGSWTAAFAYTRVGLAGLSVSRSGGPGGTLNASGTIQLSGGDVGPTTLTNGTAARELRLGLSGAFELREGFLFLPSSADLFGGSPRSDLPTGNGSLSQSFASLDLGSAGGSHLPFLASSASYAPSAVAIASAGNASAASSSPAASVSGPLIVQAEPENVPAANANGCAASVACGPGAPASNGSSPIGRGLLVLVVTSLAVTAVVAAAAVSVARRPRPAPRPNAALYPPIGEGSPVARGETTRRPGTSGSSAPTSPAEDDPLSHLW